MHMHTEVHLCVCVCVCVCMRHLCVCVCVCVCGCIEIYTYCMSRTYMFNLFDADGSGEIGLAELLPHSGCLPHSDICVCMYQREKGNVCVCVCVCVCFVCYVCASHTCFPHIYVCSYVCIYQCENRGIWCPTLFNKSRAPLLNSTHLGRRTLREGERERERERERE